MNYIRLKMAYLKENSKLRAAILRLLAISMGTVALTGLALAFVRWAGLRQSYSPPVHPWFDISTWEFRQPSREETCDPQQIIPNTGIAWLKVTYLEGRWVLDCENKSISIRDKIAQSEQKNWLIEVGSIDLKPLDGLVRDLGQFDKNKNFAIYSGSQRVARYLRKKSPQWLFAADAASLVRLHLFASMGIETVLEFWPDFVLQVPEDEVSRLSARERRELERRQKRVIVLPNDHQ